MVFIDMNLIPEEIKAVMNIFKSAGYQIYVVGGAVRDILLKKEPHDFDLTTNALPEQMIKLCEEQNLKYIPTGLKHGTITILYKDYPIEITTFRIDGEYLDNRHPDKVEFTSKLMDDLARRDLTINAMAVDLKGRVYDYFGGLDDLNDIFPIVEIVGSAEDRFNEDALRMLRVYRFASQLNGIVNVDKSTILDNLYLLRNISNERIAEELNKFLLGKNVVRYFEEFITLVAVKVPKLMDLFMIQNNKWHTYQLLTQHTAHVIDLCPKDLVTRLAALFHDLGKKACYTEEIIDSKIAGHFYDHPQKSAEIAEKCLKELKYSNDIIEKVIFLIEHHDAEIGYTKKSVKKVLKLINENASNDYTLFDKLIDLKFADRLTHNQDLMKDSKLLPIIKKDYLEIKDIIFEKQNCFSLKDLAINGNDLINLDFTPGPIFNYILNTCLDLVLHDKIENDKYTLVTWVKDHKTALRRKYIKKKFAKLIDE